jgi:hypothetical protein
MNKIRAILAAALLPLSMHASALSFSDLWWNPQQPGTGLQVVQQGETAFVTLFTYGGNGEPFWVVAPDARVYAYDATGRPAFRGPLYRTRGTAFSAPFNPADSQVIAVGELYITANGDNAITVDYTINNVALSHSLVRQTFALPGAAANYAGSFKLRMTQEGSGQPYGTREYNADFLLHCERGERRRDARLRQHPRPLRVPRPLCAVGALRRLRRQLQLPVGRGGDFPGGAPGVLRRGRDRPAQHHRPRRHRAGGASAPCASS